MAGSVGVITRSSVSCTPISRTPTLNIQLKATSSKGHAGRDKSPTRPYYLRPPKKRPYVENDKSRVKRSRQDYRVVKYVVLRKDYERLDYNATIAQRICKGLQNTDLREPSIITSKDVSFKALVPTARALDNLNDGEKITDVTKGQKKENEKTRWISLFPTEDIPIKIPEQDEVLYLTETVENLKKHSDVKRFLTISFEKEIFAYAERAYKYVQSLIARNVEQQRDQLGTINLEIRSLLVRKLPEHGISALRTSDDQPMHHNKFQFPSSRNITEGLKDESLQGCGVRGFCNTTDGFLLLVAEPKEHTDRKKIASRIKTCLSKYLDDQSEILWVESIKTSNLTARGDMLTNPVTSKLATLGCFGRRNGTGLVAITAGHFVQTGQRIQIDNSREFGTCAESHDLENVDIAIIDVNENESSRCVESFQNEKGKVCEASVYRGDELTNWPVHKIGAVTQATSGVIYSGVASVCSEEGIVIRGNTDHPVFAGHGDSGAIVFFYDPNDINHKAVKLLSIVSRDIDIRSTGAIPEDLSRKLVLTRSLKDGLDMVHHITI